MNSLPFKTFVASAVILIVTISESYWTYSCGPYIDQEKYRISYVDPDLLSDSIYQSFYRSLLRGHQMGTTGQGYGDGPGPDYQGNGWESIRDEENCREWVSYFGGKLSMEVVYGLVYHVPTASLTTLLHGIETGETAHVESTVRHYPGWNNHEEDTIDVGPAIRHLTAKRDTNFLRYMIYARKCLYSSPSLYDWSSKDSNLLERKRWLDTGRVLYDNCRIPFLKLRYGFQIVRLARYTKQYRRAIELYDSLVAPLPVKSTIRFWALGHKAGAARKIGDWNLSNYYFSQVFDSCAGYREIALKDFRLRNMDDWEALYILAKNDHERSVLWMMSGFESERLTFDYIREMYELEPSSPQLTVALLAELHRIESFLYQDMETRDWKIQKSGQVERYEYKDGKGTTVLTNVASYGGFGGSYRHLAKGKLWDTLAYYHHDTTKEEDQPTVELISAKDYVMSFRNFILNVAKDGKVLEPALWYMVAGYIDMMDGDYELADECLGEAMQNATANYDLRHQIRLLEHLGHLKKRKKIDGSFESTIAETMQWFREKQKENSHSKYDKVLAAVGQQYLLQNDVPRAILAFNAGKDEPTRNILLDIYSSIDDLRVLEDLIDNGGKTEYERMLVDSFGLSRTALIDLRGTRLIRQGKFKEAISVFETLPKSHWSPRPDTTENWWWSEGRYRTFYSSPDTTRSNGRNLVCFSWLGRDELDSVVRARNARPYTKLSLAREATRLLEKTKGINPASDSAYFKLATLLYNTPYWGYADVMWNGELLYTMNYAYMSPTSYPFNVSGIAETMEEREKIFMREYGGRHLARSYYQKAMENTSNRELAAHAAYMMDLCSKSAQTSLHHSIGRKRQDRTGYNLLMTKYRDTEYAGSILNACSVYKHLAME